MKFLLVVPLFLLAFIGSTSADQLSSHVPGPHIVPIDYDALFAMDEPPAYEPFAFYGGFLMDVAVQRTPMVYDPFKTLPDDIEKFQDTVFKEVDGKAMSGR